MDEYFATIDCMAQYPNTLGLIVANEVLNSGDSTIASPVIRAVTRDVKSYMATAAEITGQRQLPVGYSASTCHLILKPTLDYFAAGPSEEAIDFFSVSPRLHFPLSQWQSMTYVAFYSTIATAGPVSRRCTSLATTAL
jgi:1,3-beta-glucanosyltransferase GAS5